MNRRHLSTTILLLASTFSYAQAQADAWRYTQQTPAADWQQPEFDDAIWELGRGGFGTRDTPGARVGTVWNSADIWLRKSLLLSEIPAEPVLLIHHDEDVEVYINGKLVVSLSGWTQDYESVAIAPQHRDALKVGDNTLAVHCHQNTGGQFIDVVFGDATNPPTPPPLKPFDSDLITAWGAEVKPDNAWTEYPRPQLVRDQWQNLNGIWDYAVTPLNELAPPSRWTGEILVPFSLESKLGGVGRMLAADETLWYRRSFTLDKDDDDANAPDTSLRTLLNFEAVDYRCEAFLNGHRLGAHQGGNTPFTFDATDALVAGKNELIVRVQDATEAWQLRGKQLRNAHGIWYTQVSGIWQTVWIERVATSHLTDLTLHSDAQRGAITITPEIANASTVAAMQIRISDDGQRVAEFTGDPGTQTLEIQDAKLWTPDHPHLYQIEIALLDNDGQVLDRAKSYAGIRSIGKQRDANGHLRMTLNGKPLFHWGPLDQGWWPDGLLTPPSDEAMLFDIKWLKSAGFNMIRKHIKVEPRRYYYHCDRLGMMVWQDQVSGGPGPAWTRMARAPKDADWPDDQHQQFMREFEWMIDALENHPSIVVWGPFNEAWGQHRTMETGRWTVARDPSRLVNIASGGNFWPVGDIADEHRYPDPGFPLDDSRFTDYVKVVGEFGGHGFPVAGHLWDAQRDNWGYGGLPKTAAEYRDRYIHSIEILNDLRKQGIAAGVYTQTTDVEGEINGLMTYDRKVIKIAAEELRKLHMPLYTLP